MRDAHWLRRTVNKSFGSFLDRFDIQQAFQVVTVEVALYSNNSTSKVETTKFPSNGFMDTFSDLLFDSHLTTEIQQHPLSVLTNEIPEE